jgi:hypothetical protein
MLTSIRTKSTSKNDVFSNRGWENFIKRHARAHAHTYIEFVFRSSASQAPFLSVRADFQLNGDLLPSRAAVRRKLNAVNVE